MEYSYGHDRVTDEMVRDEIERRKKRARFVRLVMKKSERETVHLSSRETDDLGIGATAQYYGRLGFEFYVFRGTLYGAEGPYSEREFKLLIRNESDRESRYFERLEHRYKNVKAAAVLSRRDRIPGRVRMAVWRRDQGRCARCGSREKLEYDHIIPVSEGGSSTERNIELLCESCNRAKGKRIT
jgi:hypothetical protein